MTTFKEGQKVRVSQKYEDSEYNTDGSLSKLVGRAGEIVRDYHGPIDLYVTVQLIGQSYTMLFLPEELEAV